jgi:dCTP deaminase
VITDRGQRFDEVADEYSGPLWLEVVPLSFAVRVKEDLTLNQLRLFVGRPELTDAEIRERHENDVPILYRDGEPAILDSSALSNGLFLGLDLRGDSQGRVGFSAKDGAPVLDLTASEPARPELFWDPVIREEKDRVVLVPKKFYLLMSDEAVCIPPMMSAEMTAYDPTSGELRTHYAGFFDPGFGYDERRRFFGSRAALEVRAHDIHFMIENRQKVCKLTFQKMLDAPSHLYGAGIGSSYQRQEETLSKYFLEGRAALSDDRWEGTEPASETLFPAEQS